MANPQATIRLVRREDLAALEQIDTLACGNPRPDYMKGKLEAALDRGHGIVISLVAEVESEVVGFVMCEVYRGEFGVAEWVATVDTVGVHPDFQARGIGNQLMQALISHARKAGVERLRTIVDWEQHDLMDYFRAAGFNPAGTSILLERSVERRALQRFPAH